MLVSSGAKSFEIAFRFFFLKLCAPVPNVFVTTMLWVAQCLECVWQCIFVTNPEVFMRFEVLTSFTVAVI